MIVIRPTPKQINLLLGFVIEIRPRAFGPKVTQCKVKKGKKHPLLCNGELPPAVNSANFSRFHGKASARFVTFL